MRENFLNCPHSPKSVVDGSPYFSPIFSDFSWFFRVPKGLPGVPWFFSNISRIFTFFPLGERGGGGGKSTNPVIGKCPKDKPRRVKMFITTSGDKYISKENINLLKDLLASVVTLFFSGLYLDFLVRWWCYDLDLPRCGLDLLLRGTKNEKVALYCRWRASNQGQRQS